MASIVVHCLGPEGSYSHQLARQQFPGDCATIELHESFRAALDSIKEDNQYALLPLENSTTGFVHSTLDALLHHPRQLFIRSQHILQVRHCLMVSANAQITDRSSITRIYSHPEALQQCRHWIETNFPIAQLVPAKSSADGAFLVSESKSSAFACVGSAELCANHNLKTLSSDIQDCKENFTRFILLCTGRVVSASTSLICIEEESLNRVLKSLLLADEKAIVNITSVPVEFRPWKKLYWLELRWNAICATELDGCLKIVGI